MRVIRRQFAILLFGFTAVCAWAAYVTPNYLWYPGYDRLLDILPIAVAFALFFGAWQWLRTGRAGPDGLAYADTLPVALAIPVLVVPIVRYGHSVEDLVAGVLVAAAMVPIGLQFASQITDTGSRRLARLAVLGFAALACIEGVGIPRNPYSAAGGFSVLWVSTLAAISLVPGLMAFESLRARSGADDGAAPPLSISDLVVELAPVVTPTVACLTLWDTSGYFFTPLILWLLLLLGRRIGVERLTMALGRTTLQRDLVVSATERERARIAADIHDYALQDLTMLVRRLDAAGDAENSTAARDVADRLRAICGDLRLPILDDLGVGPALDWLVDRLEPDDERLDLELFGREQRLAPEAELAFFRVAQEAITNAIHHGAPPIVVRYWGGGDWAELTVDDAGPGIPPGAAEAAELTGHMGLMSMTQRAEAIGAELTFGRRPGGGTRIHMVWERRPGDRSVDRAPGATEPSVEFATEPEPGPA
jgi:signal transduction histidine kinase